LLLGIAAPAHATVLERLSTEELARRADAVVRGVVIDSGVELAVEDAQPTPYTVTHIQVASWLKGQSVERSEVIVLRERGGAWRGGGLWIEGTPRYRRGEEVVTFLRRTGAHFATLGMAQGKFEIVAATARGGVRVRRDLREVALWVVRSGAAPALESGRLVEQSLASLLADIRRATRTRNP